MQTLVTLLLYMSISGSVFFLVYLLSNLLTRERFTASFRYFLLKLCALVFLVPLPLIKHLVQVWLFSVNMTSPLTKEYYFFDVSHSFNLTDTGIYFPRMENYQKLLLGFWVGIMVFMILLQLHRFYIFSRNIRQYLSPAHDCDDMIQTLRAEKHLKKEVTIYYCDVRISPFTYGIRSPAIILTSLVNDESREMILLHELQHIKSHDLVFRSLALFVVLLHCFNPLAYLFFKELKEIQELNCDEKLVKSFSKEERLVYGNAIISIAANAQTVSAPALYFSKNNRAFIQKRIKKICTPSTDHYLHMAMASVALCIFTAVPILAYSPSTLDWRQNFSEFQSQADKITWMELELDSASDTKSNMTPASDESAFSDCSRYFLLTDGTVIPLPDTNTRSLSKCSHTFESGIYKKHVTKGSSCTVKSYEGNLCVKCKAVLDLTLLQDTYWPACPHNS